MKPPEAFEPAGAPLTARAMLGPTQPHAAGVKAEPPVPVAVELACDRKAEPVP